MDEPTPSHVQVRSKARAASDQKENRRGIVCLYPAASSSKLSMAWLVLSDSDMAVTSYVALCEMAEVIVNGCSQQQQQ